MKKKRNRRQQRQHLARMPYPKYLKTDHWLRLRRRVLKRDDCTFCSVGDEVLHVHHKTYERRGRERLDDLVALCGDCHKKHHDGDEDGMVDKMDILALRNGPTEARKLATI